MQVETKVRSRVNKLGEGEIILDITLLPRGSGNRSKVRKLGAEFRRNETIRPHIKKVTCGATRLTVTMRASLGLAQAVMEIADRAKQTRDVDGQLPLFA